MMQPKPIRPVKDGLRGHEQRKEQFIKQLQTRVRHARQHIAAQGRIANRDSLFMQYRQSMQDAESTPLRLQQQQQQQQDDVSLVVDPSMDTQSFGPSPADDDVGHTEEEYAAWLEEAIREELLHQERELEQVRLQLMEEEYAREYERTMAFDQELINAAADHMFAAETALTRQFLEAERSGRFVAYPASGADEKIVLCPVCRRSPVVLCGSFLTCSCGLRIDTQHDYPTLDFLQANMSREHREHGESGCPGEVSFCAELLGNRQFLVMRCPQCQHRAVII